MKKIIAALCITILSACSDAETAKKALDSAGYTDIQTNGYSLFGCDEKDTFHTAFKAKGPTGKDASGVVCAGVFKGSTIRLD